MKRSFKKSAMLGLFLVVFLSFSLYGCTTSDSKSGAEQSGREKTEIVEEADYTERVLTDLEVGQVESIIEYGDNLILSAHYPSFGIPEIDGKVLKTVDKYIDDFHERNKDYVAETPEDRAVLTVDFATYEPADGKAVVLFDVSEYSPRMAHPDYQIFTQYYNLNTGMTETIDQLCTGDYLKFFSEYCDKHFRQQSEYKDEVDSSVYSEGIAPNAENYEVLIFRKTGVEVIFNKYQIFSGTFGSVSVVIPREEAAPYVRMFKETTTEGEAVSNKQGNEGSDVDKNGEVVESKSTQTKSPQASTGSSESVQVDLQKPEPGILNIDPNKPMVALTFDDGPHTTVTPVILDALKEAGGHATFFVIGKRVAGLPDLAQRIVAEGSEIGNHTYSHPSLIKISQDELKSQLFLTDDSIVNGCGVVPKLIRPPYGAVNDSVKKSVDRPLVLWSIDTRDWETKSRDKTINAVIGKVQDGDIVLMHDIYPTTGEAAVVIIKKLSAEGYQLVTVSELMKARGKTSQPGEVISRLRKS